MAAPEYLVAGSADLKGTARDDDRIVMRAMTRQHGLLASEMIVPLPILNEATC